MALKLYLIFALTAAFLNISSASVSDLSQTQPDLIKTLLNFILKTQDTNLEELRSKISKSTSNLTEAIAATNEVLGEKVLIIDSDLVKIDFVPFRNALTKSVKFVTSRNFASNPLLGLVIERSINEKINKNSQQLKEQIDSKTIPVVAATSALITLSPVLQRNKRDVESIQQAGFVEDMVQILVRQQIAFFLLPIHTAIDKSIDSIIDAVSEFHQSVPPSDDWALDVDTTQNFIVKKVIEILLLGKTGIDKVYETIVGVSLRQKRDIGDTTTLAPPGGSPILDVILLPIRLLFEFIINPLRAALSAFTSPLNDLVKSFLTTLLEAIYPTTGLLVLTPLRQLLFYLIDTIIACDVC